MRPKAADRRVDFEGHLLQPHILCDEMELCEAATGLGRLVQPLEVIALACDMRKECPNTRCFMYHQIAGSRFDDLGCRKALPSQLSLETQLKDDARLKGVTSISAQHETSAGRVLDDVAIIPLASLERASDTQAGPPIFRKYGV